jgi:hypothetical protein
MIDIKPSFPSVTFSFCRLLKLLRMSFQKGFKVVATVLSPSFPNSKMLSPPHFSKESINSIFQDQNKQIMSYEIFQDTYHVDTTFISSSMVF